MDHPLTKYRRAENLTLEALGEAVGVSKGFLCKIEKRKQQPSLPVAIKIAQATNGAVTPSDLLSAEASRKSENAA